MFGIFFLIIVPAICALYILAGLKITRGSPRFIRWIIIAMPFMYPFAYKFTPSYAEFKTLCEADNRIIIYKNVGVEYFPTFYFSEGYRALMEKPYYGFNYNGERYLRGKRFGENGCNKICIDGPTNSCLPSECLNITEKSPNAPEKIRGKTTITDYHGQLNSLMRKMSEKIASEKYGILAERNDYTYYFYGTGLASILGGASGSAPSESCKTNPRFNYYEILYPVK